MESSLKTSQEQLSEQRPEPVCPEQWKITGTAETIESERERACIIDSHEEISDYK